jgi:hypothetical protein
VYISKDGPAVSGIPSQGETTAERGTVHWLRNFRQIFGRSVDRRSGVGRIDFDKRFKQGVRAKWIRVERKREEQEKNGASSESETAADMSEGSTEMKEDEKKGLGTGLRNTGRGYDGSGCGSRKVEGFLSEVENILISRIAELRNSDNRKIDEKGSRILNAVSLLRKDKENVVVPTDKTNRLVLVPAGTTQTGRLSIYTKTQKGFRGVN